MKHFLKYNKKKMTSEKWFKSSTPGFIKLKLQNRALTLTGSKCERNERTQLGIEIFWCGQFNVHVHAFL